MAEIDDADGVEEAAAAMLGHPGGESSQGSPHGDTDLRCPSCGLVKPPIGEMTETQLLSRLREELLRDYLVKQLEGTITHQEQNIAKTLILANLPRVDPPKKNQDPEPADDNLPEQGRSAMPRFNDFSDTDGG